MIVSLTWANDNLYYSAQSQQKKAMSFLERERECNLIG